MLCPQFSKWSGVRKSTFDSMDSMQIVSTWFRPNIITTHNFVDLLVVKHVNNVFHLLLQLLTQQTTWLLAVSLCVYFFLCSIQLRYCQLGYLSRWIRTYSSSIPFWFSLDSWCLFSKGKLTISIWQRECQYLRENEAKIPKSYRNKASLNLSGRWTKIRVEIVMFATCYQMWTIWNLIHSRLNLCLLYQLNAKYFICIDFISAFLYGFDSFSLLNLIYKVGVVAACCRCCCCYLVQHSMLFYNYVNMSTCFSMTHIFCVYNVNSTNNQN